MAAAARKFWDRCTRFVARFFVSDIVYPCQLKEPTVCLPVALSLHAFNRNCAIQSSFCSGFLAPMPLSSGSARFFLLLRPPVFSPGTVHAKTSAALSCRAATRSGRRYRRSVDRLIVENTFALKLGVRSSVAPPEVPILINGPRIAVRLREISGRKDACGRARRMSRALSIAILSSLRPRR